MISNTAVASGESPVLAFAGISTWFEGTAGITRAVDDVSLAVPAGSSLGVVGESGSGKSQTFFSVLGLTRGRPGIVRGSATIAGVDVLQGLSSFVSIEGEADSRAPRIGKQYDEWDRMHRERLRPLLGREVAMLFQDPKRSLLPYWTIRRHFEAAPKKIVAGRESLDASLTLLHDLGFAEPERIASSFPGQLSGGEAQRAMLAVMMSTNPSVLIADEPTTGLDGINAAKMLETIAEQHERTGMALVLISHDLAIIDTMVSTAVVMYGGRVITVATAKALRDMPDEALHPYVLELRRSQARRRSGRRLTGSEVGVPAPRATTGCQYRLRCTWRTTLSPITQTRCAEAAPPLVSLSDSVSVACWGIAR